MRKFENDCCGCGLPCNAYCSLKHVEHIYCDCCHEGVGDGWYIYNDEELCEYCFKQKLIDRFLTDRDVVENLYAAMCGEDELEELHEMSDKELFDTLRNEELDFIIAGLECLNNYIEYDYKEW